MQTLDPRSAGSLIQEPQLTSIQVALIPTSERVGQTILYHDPGIQQSNSAPIKAHILSKAMFTETHYMGGVKLLKT